MAKQRRGPAYRLVRTPAAATFHSFCYSLLAAHGLRRWLLSGAEQDVAVRELLCGTIGDPLTALDWPAEIGAAIGTRGLAEEVRDVLSRVAERDVDLHALARYDPERAEQWRALAAFTDVGLDTYPPTRGEGSDMRAAAVGALLLLQIVGVGSAAGAGTAAVCTSTGTADAPGGVSLVPGRGEFTVERGVIDCRGVVGCAAITGPGRFPFVFFAAAATVLTTPSLVGTILPAPPTEGDCVTKPVTRFQIVGEAVLLSHPART